MLNLDEIILRHEAATHGEWGDLPHGYRTEIVYFASDEDGKRVGIPLFDTRAPTKRADVLFVVYAHNHDIPALIAELAAVTQQRDALREALEAVEWVDGEYFDPNDFECPECRNLYRLNGGKHTATCQLAAALAQVRE